MALVSIPNTEVEYWYLKTNEMIGRSAYLVICYCNKIFSIKDPVRSDKTVIHVYRL